MHGNANKYPNFPDHTSKTVIATKRRELSCGFNNGQNDSSQKATMKLQCQDEDQARDKSAKIKSLHFMEQVLPYNSIHGPTGKTKVTCNWKLKLSAEVIENNIRRIFTIE